MSVMRHKQHGFTLIELMMVIAVVMILVAVAYPSYQDHVRRTRRAEAQAALLELAQFMERYYTNNYSYTGAALPFTQSPSSGNAFYTLGFEGGAAGTNTFTLQAVPQGGQAADSCGTLKLTQSGARTPAGCW